MFGWIKRRLKEPEDRDELDKLRGQLSDKVMALSVETDHLERLMKTMIAERAKDAH